MDTPWLRLGLLLLLVVPATSQIRQAVVDEWQPLTRGTRWLYVREIRTGTSEKPRVETHEKEEIITGIFTNRFSTLVFRKVTNEPNADATIVVRENCIFFPGEHYYDVPESQISPDSLPDVCFPLHLGMTWGDAKKLRDHWTVAGFGKKHPDDPASVTGDSWRLEAHLASGDDNYVWFRKGVGVVAERTWHNGTYTDESTRLLGFDGPGYKQRK